MTDSGTPQDGGMSLAKFGAVVVLAASIVMGAIMYVVGLGGEPHPEELTNSTVATTTPHPSASTPEVKATRAGALAVVKKNFTLGEHGRYAAACALQSPAYLAADARLYPQGSCAAALKAVTEAVKAKGIVPRLLDARVTSFDGTSATIVARVRAGSRVVVEPVYVQYHRARWWITGGGDSNGDLGY